MIHIHTDELLAAVSSLRAANGEVEHASQHLQRITTHNDWTCKERYTINENAQNLRTGIQRLQEDTERYLQAASNAADAFVSEENGVKAMFVGVESIIGKLLSIGGSSIHQGSSGISHGGGTGHSFPDWNAISDRMQIWKKIIFPDENTGNGRPNYGGDYPDGVVPIIAPQKDEEYVHVDGSLIDKISNYFKPGYIPHHFPSIIEFSSLDL